jgi:lipopolysaccharide/colanic/teichoic acid biosynthesis glycosyltransferase
MRYSVLFAESCRLTIARKLLLRECESVKMHGVTRWILTADWLWIVIALLGAEFLRYGLSWDAAEGLSPHHLPLFLLATCAVWFLLSSAMQLDGFRGGWRLAAIVSQLSLAVCFLMAALLAGGYLARQYASRLALGYFGVLLLVGFVLIRYGARLFLRARHRAGDVSRVVVVGTGHVARELVAKIEQHPEILCKVVGFLCPPESSLDISLPGQSSVPPVSVSSLGVVEVLKRHRVDELILALARPSLSEVLNLAGRCREHGINVSLVPQPYELYSSKPNFLDLDGLPVLRLQAASSSSLHWRAKRVVDLVLGLPAFLCALPIVFPAAVALGWVKGRAFVWEDRCGQNGKPFSMLRLNLDRRDPNMASFERFLHQFSITELPQLWNVFRGEMSLVGPRPENLDRVRHYSDWQQQRLSIKPGMTGLAQVHGLREQHSSEEKTRFDLQYLLHPSLLMDLSILLQTLWTLAGRIIHCPPIDAAEGVPDKMMNDVSFLPVGEVLHRAHRSQPSTD